MAEEKGMQLAQGVDITNVLVIILYLALIVAAAYFLTKYVAKRSLQKGMKPHAGIGRSGAKKNELGQMISVTDRIAIDRDKTLLVVEFQGKYYLLGTTPQGFEQIDKVDIPEAEKDVTEYPPPDIAQEADPDEQKDAARIQDTFWNRFKKCFTIVLRGYVPGVKNKTDVSFSEQLEKKVHQQEKKGKDQ